MQVCTIYAGTRGYLDRVPVDRVRDWKEAFARFLHAERKTLIDSIETDQRWDEAVEGQITEAIEAFNRQYGVSPDEAGVAGTPKEGS